jgi:hypothetical protein
MEHGSLKILVHLICALLWVLIVDARRLSGIYSPTFDVRNYGVHADGVTDDSMVYYFHVIFIVY